MERGLVRVGPRPRRTAAEWARLTAEQERSGRSVASFAAARELNAATLRWWKSELRRRGTAVAPRFVELVGPPSESSLRTTFADTTTFAASLPNGVVLRAPMDVDPERFGRLLAAAARPC